MPPAALALDKRVLALAAAAVLLLAVSWALWRDPRWVLGVFVYAALTHASWMAGLLPGMWTRRSAALPAPASDLPRRRPVWRALSELYLDTELDETDYERLAAALIGSGYGDGQLEEILYRELHPVLHCNLLSVAGEWTGFDADWLETQILRRNRSVRCSREGGRSVRRLPFAIVFGKWMVRREWSRLAAKVRRGHANELLVAPKASSERERRHRS